ncbi:hypothetical protein ACIGT4_04785 [Streptomyces sioyaensis]|uniref:hypothetical protein n=1 Tax=Streptomyces sioyaensis TaxID=67364 RepID=UPI0037D4685F
MLVDVEIRRPVDLLPDREADLLDAWLAERPRTEIFCRDRAPFYAEGTTRRYPTSPPSRRPMAPLARPERSRREVVYGHRGCLRPAAAPLNEPQEEAEPTEQGYPDGYGNVRRYVSSILRGRPPPVGPRPRHRPRRRDPLDPTGCELLRKRARLA